MKKEKKALLLATSLTVMSSSIGQASVLTVINKIPNQPIYVFISGEGSDTYYKELVGAGEKKEIMVLEENVQSKPTFKVTASTSGSGDPDWKLLGGTCSNLVTNSNHTVLIDSTAGLKLSCTDVTADNPPANN